MMYINTGDELYSGHVQAYMNSWRPGGTIPYTPGGLAWADMWGPLRYTGLGYLNLLNQFLNTYFKLENSYFLLADKYIMQPLYIRKYHLDINRLGRYLTR